MPSGHLCWVSFVATSRDFGLCISMSTGGSEEGGNVTSEAWYDAEEDLGKLVPVGLIQSCLIPF